MGFLAPLAAPIIGSIGSLFGGGLAAGASTSAVALAAAGAPAAAMSLSTALTIGSTALGTVGAVMGGVANSNMAKYRSAVASNNALISDANAAAALTGGNRDESISRYRTTQLIGKQKAIQGSSGVDVAIGSPGLVRDETQMQGDFDAMTIRYNAARQAYGEQQKAENYRAESAMEKKASTYALVKGFMGAGSSLISGAQSLTSNSAKFASAGVK